MELALDSPLFQAPDAADAVADFVRATKLRGGDAVLKTIATLDGTVASLDKRLSEYVRSRQAAMVESLSSTERLVRDYADVQSAVDATHTEAVVFRELLADYPAFKAAIREADEMTQCAALLEKCTALKFETDLVTGVFDPDHPLKSLKAARTVMSLAEKSAHVRGVNFMSSTLDLLSSWSAAVLTAARAVVLEASPSEEKRGTSQLIAAVHVLRSNGELPARTEELLTSMSSVLALPRGGVPTRVAMWADTAAAFLKRILTIDGLAAGTMEPCALRLFSETQRALSKIVAEWRDEVSRATAGSVPLNEVPAVAAVVPVTLALQDAERELRRLLRRAFESSPQDSRHLLVLSRDGLESFDELAQPLSAHVRDLQEFFLTRSRVRFIGLLDVLFADPDVQVLSLPTTADGKEFVKRLVDVLQSARHLRGPFADAIDSLMVELFDSLASRLQATSKFVSSNEAQARRCADLRLVVFDVVFAADVGRPWTERLMQFARVVISRDA